MTAICGPSRSISSGRPPCSRATGDGSFEFFSAPGEGRECVEIARRILQEARRGVAFDEIAVLVRAPAHYLGLIEHALARAGVPAYFERGTRRPHAGGRAFLALLACADEGLSANRFAEYLSLGQLPPAGVPAPVWVPPGDEVFAGISDAAAPAPPEPEAPLQLAHDDQPEIAGTLRTPRRWEWMLVEAAVIGGDPERWRRRLDGFAEELRIRLEESRRADPESSLSQALERDAARLAHLASFALPLIRDMAAWPERATWGEWLERFEQLAPSVLRAPGHVLRVLADLRPMAAVGPVGLRRGPGRAAPSGCGWSRPTRRRGATAACSSAARSRPADDRSRSCSSPGWPSVCSRRRHVRIRCCPIDSART